jgi:hypothetical protein
VFVEGEQVQPTVSRQQEPPRRNSELRQFRSSTTRRNGRFLSQRRFR